MHEAVSGPKRTFCDCGLKSAFGGKVFPKTSACYGFSVIAKVIPGMEEHLYNNAKVMEKVENLGAEVNARDRLGRRPLSNS